jgi:hypothetical protein
MKKLLFMSLASISLLLASCTKKEGRVCCGAPDAPSIMAKKNNVVWSGKPEALRIGTDSIGITGSQAEQWLIMKIKFTGKGVYTLKPEQASHELTVGGDVSVAQYLADDSATNTLEIVEYDSNRGIIRGKFNVTLKLHYRYANGAYPDVVEFSNGTFTQYLPK